MGSPTRLRYYRTHTVASSEKEKQDQKNANVSREKLFSSSILPVRHFFIFLPTPLLLA